MQTSCSWRCVWTSEYLFTMILAPLAHISQYGYSSGLHFLQNDYQWTILETTNRILVIDQSNRQEVFSFPQIPERFYKLYRDKVSFCLFEIATPPWAGGAANCVLDKSKTERVFTKAKTYSLSSKGTVIFKKLLSYGVCISRCPILELTYLSGRINNWTQTQEVIKKGLVLPAQSLWPMPECPYFRDHCDS